MLNLCVLKLVEFVSHFTSLLVCTDISNVMVIIITFAVVCVCVCVLTCMCTCECENFVCEGNDQIAGNRILSTVEKMYRCGVSCLNYLQTEKLENQETSEALVYWHKSFAFNNTSTYMKKQPQPNTKR